MISPDSFWRLQLALTEQLSQLQQLLSLSFRQGDLLNMNFYTFHQEPLLRMLRASLTGLVITKFQVSDVNNLNKFFVILK